MDWISASGTALAVFSLGVTFAVTTRGEYRFARACFWVSAILIGGNAIFLGATADDPVWQRIMVATVICGLAGGCLVAGLEWLKAKYGKEVGHKNTRALALTCNTVQSPIRFPDTGILRFGDVSATQHVKDHTIVGTTKMTGTPGAAVNWPSRSFIYKCEIINFSNEVMFDVKLDFQMTVLESVPMPKDVEFARVSGKELFVGTVTAAVPFLDKGSQNAFSFYLYNSQNLIIHGLVHRTARARIDGIEVDNIPLNGLEEGSLMLSTISLD